MHAVQKYLRDWAEPEARLAASIDGTYERALVVPACREEASLLDGYVVAAQTSRGRTLCILVVNGGEDAPDAHHAENARFLGAVIARLKRVREIQGDGGDRRETATPRAFFGTIPLADLDVLVVDRASVAARVPTKEGVGLARKIGFDLALALHATGRVRSPLLFGTDADAVLPEAHFDQPDVEERTDLAAAVFPFWHDASDDPRVTRATARHEVRLRYYVEGLAWAGSPYAFHTLGSVTAVAAAAYAAVRGVPKREAAEDFYLLNKLAKVGAIVRVPTAVVRLRSRMSDRTPFGTGASVRQALVGPDGPLSSGGVEELSRDGVLYAPACFEVLREVLARLGAFTEHADVERCFAELGTLPAPSRDVVRATFEQWDAASALEGARREGTTVAARRLRVRTWFDAFRTLKLIHALRDRVCPSVSLREAFATAPFLSPVATARDEAASTDAALVPLRVRLARAEAARPSLAR